LRKFLLNASPFGHHMVTTFATFLFPGHARHFGIDPWALNLKVRGSNPLPDTPPRWVAEPRPQTSACGREADIELHRRDVGSPGLQDSDSHLASSSHLKCTVETTIIPFARRPHFFSCQH